MHENSVPNIIATFEDTIFTEFAASVLNIMRLSGLLTARAVDATDTAAQLMQKISQILQQRLSVLLNYLSFQQMLNQKSQSYRHP